MKITQKLIDRFKQYLIEEEKSISTIQKYVHDITAFYVWLGAETLDKMMVLKYKEQLVNTYAPASVNSVISSLNSFFNYNEWQELKVKTLKIQKQIFASRETELTKAEYDRLLNTAKNRKNEKLYYLMQAICSSGIRVSEVSAITVESIIQMKVTIVNKGKIRIVFLPRDLCKMLTEYIKRQKIKSGPVFITKNGKPLDRTMIWRMMKSLCKSAGVDRKKVFPHNLRHLFARTYYSIQKDIVRLADILGHSNITTTRIYTMETGDVHKKQIQKLGLLQPQREITT